MNFWAFMKRRLIASVSMLWFAFAVALILFGVLPVGATWRENNQMYLYMPNLFLGFFMLLGLFFASMGFSVLSAKNRELAMQVSLLNQENEHMLRRLEELEGKEIS